MMKERLKRLFSERWLSIVYNVAMIVSVLFIAMQLMLSRRTVDQTNKWEKAKVTMTLIADLQKEFENPMFNNIFKHYPNDDVVLMDFDAEKMREVVDFYYNSFPVEERENVRNEMYRIGTVLDNFAYAFVNGYANEYSAYYIVGYHYVVWCNLVLDRIAKENSYELTYARQLYKLWRVRYVCAGLDYPISSPERLDEIKLFEDHPKVLADPENAQAIRLELMKKMKREYLLILKDELKKMETFRKTIVNQDRNKN